MAITLKSASMDVAQTANDVASFRGWPFFDTDEVEAVTRVLQSGKVNYWTGDEGRRFEREFAAAMGCPYGVAVANGTLALELSLRILGIAAGDEVITTSRTFIASASCIVAVGATPVFADVDRDSQNVTAETLRTAITPRTRAIIVVHLAGRPCEMDPIMDLANAHCLYVIEDCSQAHGARYKGRPVGSMGAVGAFSFCQDKILSTAGEGGMIVTQDEELFEAAWAYKDHGKSFDAVYRRQHAQGYRWLHESFGTNWRMTEMQSAVGRIQLRKLDDWVAARRRNASVLHETFANISALRIPEPDKESYDAYYKSYAFVRPECLRPGWTRDRIMETLAARGVACTAGSCGEIYLERTFPKAMRPRNRLPVARELAETALMFQVHPTLSEQNMRSIARVVEEVIFEAAD
jgi:dTDP-4-amino-4,6-dideoxygalactose transaminase